MSLLEIISVIISVIGVALTIRRNIWCWPVNFVAYGLYAKLFYDYKLYGETFLQFGFMILAIYGFWAWKKQGDVQPDLIIEKIPTQKMLVQIILSMGLGLMLGTGLHLLSDAAVPFLDAQLVSLSLLITYWTSKRYLEIWTAWIIVDLIYVGMFIYKQLYLTAGLYAGFTILAVLGLLQWKRQWNLQKVSTTNE